MKAIVAAYTFCRFLITAWTEQKLVLRETEKAWKHPSLCIPSLAQLLPAIYK